MKDKKDNSEQNILTLENYITNPTKNKGNLFLNLKSVKRDLDSRYDNLIKNKENDFEIKVYKKDKVLYVYIKEPSETYDMSYDIVFEFDSSNNIGINKCPLKTFSNCPSFAFTYGYVFNNLNLLIDNLKDKYSKDILKRLPYQRNYYEIVNIEKSLYFAIRFLLDNYGNIDDLVEASTKLPIKFFSSMDTVDKKIALNKKLQREKRKEKQKEKKKIKRNESRKKYSSKDREEKNNHIIKPKEKITGRTSSHGRVKPTHRVPRKAKITGKRKR